MPEVIDDFSGRWHFLSNFFPARVVWEQPPYGRVRIGGVERDMPELVYPSTEHAFQAAKSLDFGVRGWIASAPTPKVAKGRGWNLPGPLRKNWKQLRVGVMDELVRIKFAPWSDLAWELVGTGDAQLVEGNTWHDNFWGDCRCGRMDRCGKPGENRLGLALMAWREHLTRNGGT